VLYPDKENDVVARAKLDAKKKFGANPSTQPILLNNGQDQKPSPADEKDAYIRRRIKDDFTRLMNRQTKVFADDLSKLEPFGVGFGNKCFPASKSGSGSDANVVAAGKLLVNVLPALAEQEVSRTSQLAADTLIQALELGSLSPESFFDAIAILAENESILLGTDQILAQLFSRSASSGGTKALRTSSGVDSKLFATTNGPFIIYNTIENTEIPSPPALRRPVRQLPNTDSALSLASTRERKPNNKILSPASSSARPQNRSSAPPRESSPKMTRPTRPSKLRTTVSFAKSPSPQTKRAKLTNKPCSAPGDIARAGVASNSAVYKSNCSMNQYQSEEILPSPTLSHDQLWLEPRVNNDKVNNLFEMGLQAIDEDTDSDSGVDVPDADFGDGGPEMESTIRVEHSPAHERIDKQHNNSMNPSSSTADDINDTAQPDPSSTALNEQVTTFDRILAQLPLSELNLSQERLQGVVALYDQLSQGAAFEKAKLTGLSYPEIPRPYTDKDGWTLTGVVNEYGEEFVEIHRQSWFFPPAHNYEGLQPLQRLKCKAELDEEGIFGFPPVAGYGNEPRLKRQKLTDEENTAFEKVMIDTRKAAESRGLRASKDLTWEQLAISVKAFDAHHGIPSEMPPASPTVERTHDELDDVASFHDDSSDGLYQDSGDESDYETTSLQGRRSSARSTASGAQQWSATNGATFTKFIAVNGEDDYLKKLRSRPPTSSSAGESQRGVFDISAAQNVIHTPPKFPSLLTSTQPMPGDRYDILPPATPGTFATFRAGPNTTSNTPAASPAGTPSFMKLNFNLANYKENNKRRTSTSSHQPSASPAPSANHRRLSTATTTSSLASTPASLHPVDIDNANAYNQAKGYTTTPSNDNHPNSSANANGTSAAGSTPFSALNGGFPGGGIIINAPDRRGGANNMNNNGVMGDGRGQRRKSKAPDFKMHVSKPVLGSNGPVTRANNVRGGTVMKFN
jgi:hypothetical protein